MPNTQTEPSALHILLATFRKHSHPVVLVERHALSWAGTNAPSTFNRINILIRKQNLGDIVDDLVESGEWDEIDFLGDVDYKAAGEQDEETGLNRIPRLMDSSEKILLTLWEEKIYGMKVDDNHLRVPDFYSFGRVLAEKEMDPGRVKGLTILSDNTKTLDDSSRTGMAPVSLKNTKFQPSTYPLYVPKIAQLLQAFGNQLENQLWSGKGIKEKDPRGPQFNRTVLIRDLRLAEPRQRKKLQKQITDPVAWEELESWLDTFPKTAPEKLPIYQPRPRKVVKPVEVVEPSRPEPEVEREPTPQAEEQPARQRDVSLQRALMEEEERQSKEDHDGEPEQTQESEPVPESQVQAEEEPQAEPEPELQSEPEPEPEPKPKTRSTGRGRKPTAAVEPSKPVAEVETNNVQEEEAQQQRWTPVNGRKTRGTVLAPPAEQPESKKRTRKPRAATQPKPPVIHKTSGRTRRGRALMAETTEEESTQEVSVEKPQPIPAEPESAQPVEQPQPKPAEVQQEEPVKETQTEQPETSPEELPPKSLDVPTETPEVEMVESPPREPDVEAEEAPSVTPSRIVESIEQVAEGSFVVAEDTLQEDSHHEAQMDISSPPEEAPSVTEASQEQPEPEKEVEIEETQVPATQELPKHTEEPERSREATPEHRAEEEDPEVVPSTSQISPAASERDQTPEPADIDMGEASELVEKRAERSPSHTRFVATPGPGSYASESEKRPDSKSSNGGSIWNQPIDLLGFVSNDREKSEEPETGAHDSDVEMAEDIPVEDEKANGVAVVEEVLETTTFESQTTITHQENTEQVTAQRDESPQEHDEMEIDAASPESVRLETIRATETVSAAVPEENMSVASKTPDALTPEPEEEPYEPRDASVPPVAPTTVREDVVAELEAPTIEPERVEIEQTLSEPPKEATQVGAEDVAEDVRQSTPSDIEEQLKVPSVVAEPQEETAVETVEQSKEAVDTVKNDAFEVVRELEPKAPERAMTPLEQTEDSSGVELLGSPTKPTSPPPVKKTKIIKLKFSGPKPEISRILNGTTRVSPVVDPAVPIKRPRGRPKKVRPGEEVASKPVKKGRGKGKKTYVEEPESPSLVPTQVPTTPVHSLAPETALPPPSTSQRGRPLARSQPSYDTSASPVKRRGRPPKSQAIIDLSDTEPAYSPKKEKPAKPKATPRAGKRRVLLSEDEEMLSEEESEVSLVESSDDDDDFVLPIKNVEPPKRALRARRGGKKSYAEHFDSESEEEEEEEEEEVAAVVQAGPKFKSPEVQKAKPKSPSPETTTITSPVIRTPSPRPIEERSPTPESEEEEVTPVPEAKQPTEKKAATPEPVAEPTKRPTPTPSELAAAKKSLEEELFGSDDDDDKEPAQPVSIPGSAERNEVETPVIEDNFSPLRDMKTLLPPDNEVEQEEELNEEEFKTAEDNHQSERQEEFYTPPEQQLLHEQAMHGSEERHESQMSEAMDTADDHPQESADNTLADTTMEDVPVAQTPEPVPQTDAHQLSEEPAPPQSAAAPSPEKLPSAPLDSEIPVPSPEEIQEFSKVLEKELERDPVDLEKELEKDALDMDNTIRDALLQDSDNQYDIGKLTSSLEESRSEEKLQATLTEPNLERLHSVSEAENQAAVDAFVAEASKDIQSADSLFPPTHQAHNTSMEVTKMTGKEESRETSTPIESGLDAEPCVETEVHVDLEIRERLGASTEEQQQKEQEPSPQTSQHDVPQPRPEPETPQGFPEPQFGIGQTGVLQGHQAEHEADVETNHDEQRQEEDTQQTGNNTAQVSEPHAQEQADVTLEPKVEDESEGLQEQSWETDHQNSNEYFGMVHPPQHPLLQENIPHLQPPLQSPTEVSQGPALHLPPMLSPVSETASQSIELPRILPQIQFSQPQNLPPGLPQKLLSSIHPAKRPRLDKSRSDDRETSPVHASATVAPPTETTNLVSSRIPPPQSPPAHQQQSPSLGNGSFAPAEPDWNRDHKFADNSPFPSPTDVVRRQPAPRHEDTTPRGRPTPREERDKQVMGPPSRLPDRFGPQFNNTPTRQRLAAKLAARAAAGNQQRTPKSAAPQRIGSLEIREVTSDRLEERLQRRLQERMREKMKSKRTKEEPPRRARQEQRLQESLRQRLEQDFDRGSREPSVARVTEPQRRPLHINKARGFDRREDDYNRFDDGFDDYERDNKHRQSFDRRPNGFVNRPADSHREETLRWTQEQRTRIRDEIGHTPTNRNRPPVPDWTPESVTQPDFADFDDRDEPVGKKMRYDYDPVHEDQYRTIGSASREDSRIAQRLQETHSSVYQTPTNNRSQQNHNSFNSSSFTRDFHTMEMNLPWPFPGITVKRYTITDPGFQNLQDSVTQATVTEEEPQLDGEDEIDDADHHSLQSAQVVSPRDIYQQQPDEDSENSGEDDGTDFISQSQQGYLQPPPAQPTRRKRGRPRGSGKGIQMGSRVGAQETDYPNDSTPSTRGGAANRRGRAPGRPRGSGTGSRGGRTSKAAATGEIHDSSPGQTFSTPRKSSAGQGSFPQGSSQSAYFGNSQPAPQGTRRDSRGHADGNAPKKRGRPRKNFAMKDEHSYYGNGTARRTSEDNRTKTNGAHDNSEQTSMSTS